MRVRSLRRHLLFILLSFIVKSNRSEVNSKWIRYNEDFIEVLPETTPRATLIYLHGALGDSPLLTLLRFWTFYGRFRFQNIRLILPRAPFQHHSASGGIPWKIWFDRDNRNISTPEKYTQIDHQADRLSRIIRHVLNQATPSNTMVIGGFSLGGAMALHLCLRYFPEVAGCAAEGAFLSSDSAVYRYLDYHRWSRRPPVLLQSGQMDRITSLPNVLHTFRSLQQRRTPVSLVVYDKQGHVPGAHSTANLLHFISRVVPL